MQLIGGATGLTATAGNGGVYCVEWGASTTFLLAGASATGAGNILVVAANASGSNLTVAGPVTTGSGNILLAADDNFVDSAAVGGAGFSGQVYFGANRDQGNTGTLTMTAGAGSITTSNATANAVLIEDYGGVTGTVAGNLVLGNITVGNGGTITATTVPTLGTYDPTAPTSQGEITAGSANVVLNAGPMGTVVLTAAAQTGSTNTVGIGTAALPIGVSAGTVDVTISSSLATAATNSVYVTGNSATNFTASVLGSAAGSLNLTTTSGALSIGGATTTAGGGAINLTGAGGVVLNAPLGSSTAGAISITGPLTGTGSIMEGTGVGPLTLTQSTTSTYGGVISGPQAVAAAGTGNLILSRDQHLQRNHDSQQRHVDDQHVLAGNQRNHCRNRRDPGRCHRNHRYHDKHGRAHHRRSAAPSPLEAPASASSTPAQFRPPRRVS